MPTAVPAAASPSEMPERIVTVTRFEQLWREPGEGGEGPRAAFAIECGSGTYVRSLIADLGDAYCLTLRRTAIGPFDVAEAIGPPPRGTSWSGAAAGTGLPRARPGPRACRSARRLSARASRLSLVKVTRLPDVERGVERSVAVGTFDGVHLGHREVIAGADSVLTFDPHPVSVVAPQHTPKLLTTLERKAELVASLGVQEMIVIPFDKDFAARSAAEFIDEVLVEALGARQVAIGENFRFGHRAQGDPALLSADTRFETVVHPLLEVDGEIVSSSHIRGLLGAGEVRRGKSPARLGLPARGRGVPRR